MDDWRELRSVYERTQLEHEMALWTEIVRRENSFLGRVKRLINSMRCVISNGWQR